MSYRNLLFIIVLLPTFLDGQVLSNKGRFSVEFDRGCTPMTVNITEMDTFSNDPIRQYYYEEGLEISSSKTHTYTEANTYKITQLILGTSDVLEVQVFDSFKPSFNIEKCSGNEVSVTSEEITYDFIRVYFGGADSAQLNINESFSHQYSSNNIQSIGFKGFFNDADNKCDSYFEQVAPILSLPAPNATSVTIKESCKDVFTLYLNLDSVDSLINYQITLSQTSTNIVYDGRLKSTNLIISDIPFISSESAYCIQVDAIDPCNSARVEGNQVCQQSSSLALSPFESLYSSYTNNGIFISLDDVSSGYFNVFRRRRHESFKKEDSVTKSYTDQIGSNSREYFYQIDYVDSCDQTLFSAETNPPLIEANKQSKNSYSVNFTFPNPLEDGVYVLESIVGDNQNSSIENYSVIQNSMTENTFNFEINLNAKDGTSAQRLTTKLYSEQGELLRQSNSINLKFEIEIYVPTAFTPNNDGLNDTLEFFGLPSSTAEIKIYSKWGHLIYSSDNPSLGWDGTIDGKTAPEGTYLYEIIFESTQGEKLRQKGTFALITK